MSRSHILDQRESTRSLIGRCLEESIQPFTDTEITDFCKENERLKPIHRDLSTACQTPKSEWRKDVGMRLQRAHHDLTEFSRCV